MDQNLSYICISWYSKICWFLVNKYWCQQNSSGVSRDSYIFWIFFRWGTTVPSFIIVGYVWRIILPHPWAAPKRPILNRVKNWSDITVPNKLYKMEKMSNTFNFLPYYHGFYSPTLFSFLIFFSFFILYSCSVFVLQDPPIIFWYRWLSKFYNYVIAHIFLLWRRDELLSFSGVIFINENLH